MQLEQAEFEASKMAEQQLFVQRRNAPAASKSRWSAASNRSESPSRLQRPKRLWRKRLRTVCHGPSRREDTPRGAGVRPVDHRLPVQAYVLSNSP